MNRRELQAVNPCRRRQLWYTDAVVLRVSVWLGEPPQLRLSGGIQKTTIFPENTYLRP